MLMQGYIVFDAHPISGVFFVRCVSLRMYCFMHPWGAFCFSWEALEYESNGKSRGLKGELCSDDRHYITFEK